MSRISWIFSTLLCLSSYFFVVFSLQENAVNVDTYYVTRAKRRTTSCGFLGWDRCTRYKTEYVKKFRCAPGYRSKDNVGCPFAVCDDETNPEACNIDYKSSHIIYSNGVTQYSSGGTCNDPGVCSNCKDGFYNSNERCRMCTAITNCDLEECTTSTDQTCTRCEGVLFEEVGKRAYTPNTRRTACNKACSWRPDSTYCYPGTCPDELASSCRCSTGFSRDKCQTMTEEPTIGFNMLRLTASNGDTAEAPPDVNSGPPQDSSWTNIASPATVQYELTAVYKMSVTPPARPAFIKDFTVGITGASVVVDVKRGGHTVKTQTMNCPGASRDSPDTDSFPCKGSLDSSTVLPLPLEHRDSIEFRFEASNGGKVRVRDLERNTESTHYYEGNSKVHSYTLSVDLNTPTHCTNTPACVDSMLAGDDLITTSEVSMRWSGWQDADSGLSKYVLEVHELHAVADHLQERAVIRSLELSASSRNAMFTLDSAGVYSLTLSAYDKAGNYKSARRIVMYDPTSSVTTRANSKLLVSTGSKDAPDWQTSTSRVRFDWSNRYINTLHHRNNWLLPVASVSGVSSLYDDSEGDRTLAAIDNIQGIVRISTAFLVDHSGGSSIESVPSDSAFSSQGLGQSQTITPSLVDGDTVRFWVRAWDMMSRVKEESTMVHIDTSPPIIDDLWLTKGDRLNISVHSLQDLTAMTFEWIAYDVHSGLESISWKITDRFEEGDVVHGVQHLTTQGETGDLEECTSRYAESIRGANCYCTPATGCYHRHFHVKPTLVDSNRSHGGIFANKYKGVHDSDYHIEVTATNHAKLTTTKDFKITIDSSPPLSGHIHEGMPGQQEVDYQQDLHIYAHWAGFFDRESGVKFYQYGFSTSCLNEDNFGLDLKIFKISETSSNMVSWRAPTSGRYYVTVLAYNGGLAASAPLCSDGVTIDTTPPSLGEIAVLDARIVGGLVKTSDNSVWVIDDHRRRSLVLSPGSLCRSKAAEITLQLLSEFPLNLLKNGSVRSLSNQDCSVLAPLPDAFFKSFYLRKDYELYVNWTGHDEESGVYDYELGLMSDASDVSAPDLLPYTSTHHHPHFQTSHPLLAQAQTFYIALRATNKAGLSSTKVLGPVIVHTLAASFTGSIITRLDGEYLIAQWEASAFSDPEADHLKYEVAVGTNLLASVVRPFQAIESGGSCELSWPPTCAAVPVGGLHWDLHHSHTYFLSVRVTNVVGLSVVARSEPYLHDVRLPAQGVVIDICPEEEEHIFNTNNFVDTDQQLSTSSLSARWHGFQSVGENISYRIGVGSTPLGTQVRPFVSIGSELQYTFNGLKLEENQKYYMTVEASNGAGKTFSSSNGRFIVRNGVDMSHIIIKDGPWCKTVEDSSPSSRDQVTCESDTDYQSSTSVYTAHWVRSKMDIERYPEVTWSLEERLPHSDSKWRTVRPYERIGPVSRLFSGNTSLSPGSTYRAAVRFCAGLVCSMPTYSDGTTIIPSPPKLGTISLQHLQQGENSQITVEMDRFYDPDILVRSEAYEVMERYEWALSDDSQARRMLTTWKPIESHEIVDGSNKMQFRMAVEGGVETSRCRWLCVRGYNFAGRASLLTVQVHECSALDPPVISPPLVLDVLGETQGHNVGKEIVFDTSKTREITDVDYTGIANMLSGVWPRLRHGNYTWAVLESDQANPLSHPTKQSVMALADPCTTSIALQCGQTENNFINAVFTDESLLKHGKRYYICIRAGESNEDFEKWTDELGVVSACSDGVTVDLSSPVAGTVHVLGLTAGRVQVSTSEVRLEWSGFTDIEEVGVIPHTSGIAYYEVALGSTPEGEDVQQFHSVGSVTHVILTRLQLPNGARLYVSVRATDHVNRSITAVSGAFVVDSSPPYLTGRQIQLQNRYIASRSLRVCWQDVFTDDESGMKVYWVALGTKPGFSDIVPFTSTEGQCHNLDTQNNVREGHQYYLTVEGYSYADLSVEASTGPLTAATTPPTVGVVLDTQQGRLDSTDLDFASSDSGVGTVWTGFQSSGASISHYTLTVGTCPGCDDKLQEFEVGISGEFYFADHTFAVGVRYFATVRACTSAGLCSSATSDGFLVDPTLPKSGTVFDGTGDGDIRVQSSRTFLGCKYFGFSDPESGLHHYEWRVGTSPGADNILAATNSGLKELAFYTLSTDQQLPEGQKLYTTVRAYNKAGGFAEVTSNGFFVDPSPPEVVLQPKLEAGFASLVPGSTVSRNGLSISWSFADPESSILNHYLSISSHTHVHLPPLSLQLPGFVEKHVLTGLSLQDGCSYKVKVTACNPARLCTTALSQSVLVDTSKPNTGSLAVETDHAADLRRQVLGWMDWTTNSMNLTWLGFNDLHSGLQSYTLLLGSRPFASDLNQDGKPFLVPHTSEGIERAEGVVQTAEIPTRDLHSKQVVFVSIRATNKVGLTSEPLLRQVRLEGGGSVWLVRRCRPYSCLGHCACGALHSLCEATTSPCAVINNNTNSEVTVNDVIDLTFPPDITDVDVTPLTSVMAASWSVTHTEGRSPQRYEYSVGECEDPEPHGVFNINSDRVWRDAGNQTFAIISLPQGSSLTAGTRYCFFVRAWYQSDTYAVFKSDGVLVDEAASSMPIIPGNKVKECRSLTDCKDIDFQTDQSSITVSWSHLVPGHSDSLHYTVYIGTQPGAHDTHESKELLETRYTARGLSLESNTVYYSSVLARTETGLLAWAVSDGVQLDLLPPTPGIVLDGTGGADEDYSSSVVTVSAWWQGFTDPDSAITSYSWCVGSTDDVADCSVVNWTVTGLLTAYTARLDSPLLAGTVVYSKVYAVDAAGHSSPVVVSDGLLLDSSPPLTRDVLYLGPNILANPSFEDELTIKSDSNCSVIPAWNSFDGSCVKLKSQESPLAHDGDKFVNVVGSIAQNLENLNVGQQYKVSLFVGYPPEIHSQRPAEIVVSFGKDTFSFTLDPIPCNNDCSSGYESVILWHKHTQRVTIRETSCMLTVSCRSRNVEFVLDDITVQTIKYLPGTGSRTELESHLQTHAVFLPHWASIHTAWHFFDTESPVVNYRLALGTSPGGTQLQPYRDVGPRTEATVTFDSPTPRTGLHLSVQATNAAGLASVAHSIPIIVDVTPPSFQDVNDGQVYDVDYQSGSVMSVSWKVTDEESGIKHCDWAIGRTKGGSDVKRYSRVFGKEDHAEYDLKNEVNTFHSLILYSTVRCHNNVGLASTATTDGVRILNSPLGTSHHRLTLLPYNSSVDTLGGQCHNSQHILRLSWDTIETQIKSLRVGIEGQGVLFQKIVDKKLTYDAVTLSGLQLVLNSPYEAFFITTDVLDQETNRTIVNFTTPVQPPVISEGDDVSARFKGGEITLDWSTLFLSPQQLHFLVRLGTVQGGADIASLATGKRHVTFSLVPHHMKLTSVDVTIAALDSCGQTTFYSKNVPLVP